MEDLKAKIAEFERKLADGTIQLRPGPAITCTDCGDSGMESFIRDDGTEAVRQCTRCDYWAKKRGLTPGVPDDERQSTLANYKPNQGNKLAIEQAQQFLDGVHPNLFIHGGVGVGKTRLACSIANTEWRKPNPPSTLFIRCPELLLRLQPGGDSDTDIGDWFDRVTQVDLLVLDDISAQQGTDFARRMLQSIYDKRLDLGKRTIFTSNADLDTLSEFLTDDRLSSRIVGSAKIIRIDGKDQRKEAGKSKLTGQSSQERRTRDTRRQQGDPRLPTGDRD